MPFDLITDREALVGQLKEFTDHNAATRQNAWVVDEAQQVCVAKHCWLNRQHLTLDP